MTVNANNKRYSYTLKFMDETALYDWGSWNWNPHCWLFNIKQVFIRKAKKSGEVERFHILKYIYIQPLMYKEKIKGRKPVCNN